MELHGLAQALHQTRLLAATRSDDDDWRDLGGQVDGLLERLTTDAADPTTPAIGAQRLDQTQTVGPEQARVAVAALAALHDRPDRRQLDLARKALQDLGDSFDA